MPDKEALAAFRAALAGLRLDEALGLAAALKAAAPDPAEHARLDGWIAVALLAGGRLDEAEATARAAVGRAQALGHGDALWAARYAQAQVLLALGRYAEARDVLALQVAALDADA